MQQTKKRNITWDIVKGVAILTVMVGHSGASALFGGLVHDICYSFHVPLFFIVSGFFFKEREPLVSFKRDFERQLLPYWFFAVVALAVNFFAPYVGLPVTNPAGRLAVDLLMGVNIGMLWFLWALFWGKNVYNLICVKVSNQKMQVVLSLLTGTAAYLFSHYTETFYWQFLQGLSVVPFILVGHRLRGFLENCAEGRILADRRRKAAIGGGFYSGAFQ